MEVVNVDTLEPIKYHSMLIYSGNLQYNLLESYKTYVIDESIPIVYQITEHSHMRKAEPNIGEKYIAFTVYDSTLNAYTLPEHKWSLVEVTESNAEVSKNIIKQIIQNPNLNDCKYFNLISSIFGEAISPINKDLQTLSYYTRNVDSTYCIDESKKEQIFSQYEKSKNKLLLPFIRNYKQDQIDNELQEEISLNLTRILESKEMYWIEEACTILDNLSNLSYIYNDKTAEIKLDKISKEYFTNFDKEFVNKVNDLLKEYGS